MLDDDEARMKPKAWKAFQEKIKEIEKKQSSSSDDSEAEKKALSDKSTMSSFSTSEAFKTAPTNAQKIWVFLTEHGFTDVQAAAILGNIQAESDFNPRATDGGLGLIQWIGGRASNLRRYAGNSMWTIEGQLTFMIHELNTYESTAYAKLKAAKTPAEGAYVWDRYFERSAGWSTRTRMKNAVKWYNTFHNGKVLKDMETIETGSADSKSKTDTGQSGSKTDTKKTSSESKSNKENKENKKDNEIKKTDKTDQKKQETENTKKSESGKTESAGTDTAASSTGTATAGSQTSADAVGNTQTTANSAVSQSSDASAQTQNPSVSA